MNTDRFKFRVWDKVAKRYIQSEEWCINCFGVLHFQSEFLGDDIPRNEDDYIIEQCTGLKDKNCKLIYEGDVIKFEPQKLLGPVKWSSHPFSGAWYVDCEGRALHFTEEWEIIGNIHKKKWGIEK